LAAGDLGDWLRGYVEVEVAPTAGGPGAFGPLLNALIAARVPFRRARTVREPEAPVPRLTLRLGAADFRRLRPAVRGRGLRVRIRRRRGLPFLLARLARRPALVGSALAAGLAVYLLSGYVWLVQVQGTDRLTPGEVLRAAASLGLRPGVRRSAVDGAEIGRRLPILLPELSWASVQVHGVLAAIQVVEKVSPSTAYEQALVPGDVVAAHGGVVTGVTVLAGTAVVRPGDVVRPGAVLIRGQVTVPVARSRTSGMEGLRTVPVHAAGVVMARARYQTYAEAPLLSQVEEPTGRVFVRRVLVAGRLRLTLQGWRPVPFAAYRLERYDAALPALRGVRLPLELVTLRYVEVRPEVRRWTVAQAQGMALAEARAFLARQMPPRSRLVGEQQRTLRLPGGRVGVELSVETEDNIGVFRAAAEAQAGPDGAP
jgi:similar to stage IV sporulation protein